MTSTSRGRRSATVLTPLLKSSYKLFNKLRLSLFKATKTKFQLINISTQNRQKIETKKRSPFKQVLKNAQNHKNWLYDFFETSSTLSSLSPSLSPSSSSAKFFTTLSNFQNKKENLIRFFLPRWAEKLQYDQNLGQFSVSAEVNSNQQKNDVNLIRMLNNVWLKLCKGWRGSRNGLVMRAAASKGRWSRFNTSFPIVFISPRA